MKQSRVFKCVLFVLAACHLHGYDISRHDRTYTWGSLNIPTEVYYGLARGPHGPGYGWGTLNTPS